MNKAQLLDFVRSIPDNMGVVDLELVCEQEFDEFTGSDGQKGPVPVEKTPYSLSINLSFSVATDDELLDMIGKIQVPLIMKMAHRKKKNAF